MTDEKKDQVKVEDKPSLVEESAPRPKETVPEAVVFTTHEDFRMKTIEKYEEQDPGFMYSWSNKDRDQRFRDRRNQIVVKDKHGEIMDDNDDVLIKIPKDIVMDDRIRRETRSRQTVERAVLAKENDYPDLDRRKARFNQKAKAKRPPSEIKD